MGLGSTFGTAGGVLADIGYQSDWWHIVTSSFMRNAFAGGTLVALTAGVLGYFVVVRRETFAAHALAHIGFPGATGAILVGAPVTLGLAVFCVAGALAVGAMGKQVERREIATGTILAFAMALGLLFSSMAATGSATRTGVLFGNLLTITPGQLAVDLALTVVVLGSLAVLARPLLFASVTPDVAEARGVPVRALGIAFLVLLAIVVTLAVQVVGSLLLFALVVAPAASALSITARPAAVVALGTAISLVAVWGGLVITAMFSLPPSFPIVSIVTVVWLVCEVRSRLRRRAT